MVTLHSTQLTAPGNEWRDVLRQHRELLSSDRARLQESASRCSSREECEHLDHLANQVHIQLINIHDLRHAIRSHIRRVDYESNVYSGRLQDDTIAAHEGLHEQVQHLLPILEGVEREVRDFVVSTSQ